MIADVEQQQKGLQAKFYLFSPPSTAFLVNAWVEPQDALCILLFFPKCCPVPKSLLIFNLASVTGQIYNLTFI